MGAIIKHNKKSLQPLLFLIFICLVNYKAFSQDKDTIWKTSFTASAEVRPRVEFRNNFIWQSSETANSELYISQRNRLELTCQRKRMKFHASLQEIHLWGKSGMPSSVGSINAFEYYVEPAITKNIFIRIGRQGLSLDNGRLFSSAP